MSQFFRRVTSVFKRKPKTRRTSPTPARNPYNRQSTSRNTRASPELADDGSDDDEGSIIEDYVVPPARNKEPVRRDEPPNRQNGPLRSVPNGILPNLPQNADPVPFPATAPPSRPNPTDPAVNAPQQASLDGRRTDISANQTSIPTVTRLQPIPVRRNLTPLMNMPRRPLDISPHSTLIGFPSEWRPPPTTVPQRPYRSFGPSRVPPQRQHFPNYEYDYPIENVVIDGNIPSFITTKINRAVDQDRFGRTRANTHRTVSQSRPNAVRHIREIPLQNSYHPEPLIIHQVPHIYCSYNYDPVDFPQPFHHYVAHALPNDPMRSY